MKKMGNFYIAGSIEEALRVKERLEKGAVFNRPCTIESINIGGNSVGGYIELNYSWEEEDCFMKFSGKIGFWSEDVETYVSIPFFHKYFF